MLRIFFFFLFLVDATYDFKQFVSFFAYTDGMIELVFEYWLLILSFHFTSFFISILHCVKHWKIFYTTFSYTLPNTVKWKYFPANILHVKYFTFANILHRNKRSVSDMCYKRENLNQEIINPWVERPRIITICCVATNIVRIKTWSHRAISVCCYK